MPLSRTIAAWTTVVILVLYFAVRPTNDANWAPDQAVLPYATILESGVTVHNVRNFAYTSTTEYTTSYYDETYDTSKLTSVDYIVEPFGDFSGSAHTFLSFGFSDGKRVAISVEIRKKVGQTFSPFKALFKQYELMYVIADENDVVKLRSNYRNDDVYIYPPNIDQEHQEKLFISMVSRANKLYSRPEFYNLITNTCTTNIVRHVNEIAPGQIPWNYQVLMPGYSDKLAYKLGLIRTPLPYEHIRETFRINDKAKQFADDPDFSNKIRE